MLKYQRNLCGIRQPHCTNETSLPRVIQDVRCYFSIFSTNIELVSKCERDFLKIALRGRRNETIPKFSSCIADVNFNVFWPITSLSVTEKAQVNWNKKNLPNSQTFLHEYLGLNWWWKNTGIICKNQSSDLRWKAIFTSISAKNSITELSYFLYIYFQIKIPIWLQWLGLLIKT